MSEDPKQRFHQFPLALLAYGKTEMDTITAIVAYGTITAGIRFEKKLGGEDEAREFLDGKGESVEKHMRDPVYRGWAIGKNLVGCYFPQFDYCRWFYQQAENFLSTFGASPQVRVPSDIIRETERGQFDFREFTVLASIYAVIGNKQYAIVRRDRVRAGALGYSSASVLFNENGNLTRVGNTVLAKRLDGRKPLSIDQVRYTIERLHSRKLFCKIQPKRCGRTVYYSRGLNHDDLAQRLIERDNRKSGVDAARHQAELRLREHAALLKRGISGENAKPKSQVVAGSPSESPSKACESSVEQNGFILSPDVTRTSPAQSPEESPDSPRFNVCFPNVCSLNEYSPNGCVHNGALARACGCDGEKITGKLKTAAGPSSDFEPPTEKAVEEFFASLRLKTMKRNPSEMANEWFNSKGADQRWTTEDWKGPASKWLLDRRHQRAA